MSKVAEEFARQSLLNEETLGHAELSIQQARIIAGIANAAVIQCHVLDSLTARVARLEELEKKVKKLKKKVEELQKVSSSAA